MPLRRPYRRQFPQSLRVVERAPAYGFLLALWRGSEFQVHK
jgi:hypothetical protein